MVGVRFIAFVLLTVSLAHGQKNNVPPDIQAALAPYKPVDLGDAFREACWKGDLAIATRLLDAGAPIEGRDSYGRTGLFDACHGDPDVVKMLIARGAKIDVVAFNGDTTMGRACEYGDLASAQMLLAAGADLTKANKFGRTPLILAAREGHDDLVAFLIAQHVDVNVESPDGNALAYATWKDHLSIAKMLIDAGAKEESLPADGSAPTAEPLMVLAALTNDTQLMDLLLANGADINRTNKNGLVPILMAIADGKPETVAYLLDKGADPQQRNSFDENALTHATLLRKPDVMKILFEHHVPLETKDKLGRTALIWACCHMDDPEIQLLVGWGADVNTTDLKGETPLSYVNDRGDTAMAQLLLNKGAKPQEPHIIDREKSTEPLTPMQTWAMAVGAIYDQTNGESHHVLGAGTPKEVSAKMLADY